MHLFRSLKRLFGSFIIHFITLLRRLSNRPSPSLVYLLLLFVFAYSAWQLLCALSSVPPSSRNTKPYSEWNQRFPSILRVTKSNWDIRRFWPTYLAKGILPTEGTTLIYFSSLSPFPLASHLSDPRFVLERSHANNLLTTILHGLVSRVIWIYPSSLRNRIHNFHLTENLLVGVTVITSSDDTHRTFNWSQGTELLGTETGLSMRSAHHSNSPEPADITAICICPVNGELCSLPLLHSAEVRIPSNACSPNTTVTFEQVIDVLADSLLHEASTPKKTYDDHLHDQPPDLRAAREIKTTTTRPWITSSDIPYKSIPTVVVLHSNYFASSRTGPLSTMSTSSLSNLSSQPAEPYSGLIHELNLRLQTLFNELTHSLPTSSSSPSSNTTPVELTTHYFNTVYRFLAPHHEYTIGEPYHLLLSYNRCSLDPHAIQPPLTLAEQVLISRWESLLSIRAKHTSLCHLDEPLIQSFTQSIPFPASVRHEIMQLWRWLCSLDMEQHLHLSKWVPCTNSTMSIDPHWEPSHASLVPSITLCRRPSGDFVSFNQMQSSELALMLDRLRSVFHNLPTPRLITLLGGSSTSDPTPDDRSFFQTLCTFFDGLY